jgi:transcriptional regulator with XRE-family HTH domain
VKKAERKEYKQELREKVQKELGKVIAEIRNAEDLSQEDLAYEAGIDRSFMSKLERGVISVSLLTLIMIAEKLNRKPSEILAVLEERLGSFGG